MLHRPNPDATIPFPTDSSLNDPVFVSNSSNTPAIANVTNNVSNAWGLRILKSQGIYVYGAGLYSFFDNYSTGTFPSIIEPLFPLIEVVACSATGNGEVCQRHIFSVEDSSGVSVYNLNTVGTTYQITLNGRDEAYCLENVAGFIDNVALFRDDRGL
jgi:glucan 1,3-beta-glucosidase